MEGAVMRVTGATATAPGKRMREWAGVLASTLAMMLLVGAAVPVAAQVPAGGASTVAGTPVDAQQWVDQKDLTWAAYRPVPQFPAGWADGSVRGTSSDYKGAVVLLD